MNEKELQRAVCNYLKLQYSNVLFHSDFGAGLKMTIGQAKYQKTIQKVSGWPDLFIAEPGGGANGLFLELKKAGTNVIKKNGDYYAGHITKQAEVLHALKSRGYAACFAVGFEEAKRIIDRYLSS